LFALLAKSNSKGKINTQKKRKDRIRKATNKKEKEKQNK
jgi:hypothetical protein